MGPLEPKKGVVGHEIGVVGEVLAPTQELSHTIANNARASILHFAYPGQIATTGNFASPFSPHEQEAGPCFMFSLYHLVDLHPGEQRTLFPVTMHTIDATSNAENLTTITSQASAALENGELAPIVKKAVPSARATMSELASIVRSKNSGPFELTLDIMFDSSDVYNRVKRANVLHNDVIKKLYSIGDADIITNMYFDPALAWKCTVRRSWAQGSVGERDVSGSTNLVCPCTMTNTNKDARHSTTCTSPGHRSSSFHTSDDHRWFHFERQDRNFQRGTKRSIEFQDRRFGSPLVGDHGTSTKCSGVSESP